MRTPTRHTRNRRFVAFAVLVVAVVVPLLVWQSGFSGSAGLTGSLSSSANALAMESALSEWNTGGSEGSLDDELTVSWKAVNGAPVPRSVSLRMVASRDEAYSPTEDCEVGRHTVAVDAGASDTVRASVRARAVSCLDAGMWALLLVDENDVVVATGQPFSVANGPAEVELTATTRDVPYRGEFDATVAVYRPAASDGFDGLRARTVDVWFMRDDVVCVASVDGVDVPRNPVMARQSWDRTDRTVTVDIRKAQRVEGVNPFSSTGAVPAATDVTTEGSCRMDEGPWKVLAGPTDRAFVSVQDVYVHAPPVVVEPAPVEITLPSGEVTEVSRLFYNPSTRAVSWSARAATSDSDRWLIASSDQELDGRSRVQVPLTVSAFGLAPGVYSSEFVVQVNDFYGTEVRIPVELNVLMPRSTTAGALHSVQDAVEQPTTFSAGNFPNPFRGSTTIRVNVAEPGHVDVSVFDVSGREITTVFDGPLAAGSHDLPFDGSGLPGGTYLYRVRTPHGVLSHTMTLIN